MGATVRSIMSVTISIPDDIAAVLGGSAEEREVRIKEALALELYREGKISLRRMGELAGAGGDYWAADAFRSLHGVPLNYSVEDVESDSRVAETFIR